MSNIEVYWKKRTLKNFFNPWIPMEENHYSWDGKEFEIFNEYIPLYKGRWILIINDIGEIKWVVK